MRCIGFVKWFGVLLLLDSLVSKVTATCRWSNEGCYENEDCCSQSCERAHEGAHKRCSKSEINLPCYADYMCEDGLQCGRKYKCCTPYWGICNSNDECCDSEHFCNFHKGFTYKRCLFPSLALKSRIDTKLFSVVMLFWVLQCINYRT